MKTAKALLKLSHLLFKCLCIATTLLIICCSIKYMINIVSPFDGSTLLLGMLLIWLFCFFYTLLTAKWKILFILIKLLWVAGSLLALYLGINCAVDMRPENHDCPETFGIILFLILNFPISIIGIEIMNWYSILINFLYKGNTLNFLDQLIKYNTYQSILVTNIFTWIIITILGYIQWFVVLPYLMCKIYNFITIQYKSFKERNNGIN